MLSIFLECLPSIFLFITFHCKEKWVTVLWKKKRSGHSQDRTPDSSAAV
jgi:hypothetical protein